MIAYAVGLCTICASFVLGGRYVYVQAKAVTGPGHGPGPAPGPAPSPIPEPNMIP